MGNFSTRCHHLLAMEHPRAIADPGSHPLFAGNAVVIRIERRDDRRVGGGHAGGLVGNLGVIPAPVATASRHPANGGRRRRRRQDLGIARDRDLRGCSFDDAVRAIWSENCHTGAGNRARSGRSVSGAARRRIAVSCGQILNRSLGERFTLDRRLRRELRRPSPGLLGTPRQRFLRRALRIRPRVAR